MLSCFWVLVKGFHLNYHNKETLLFTLDPYSGILIEILLNCHNKETILFTPYSGIFVLNSLTRTQGLEVEEPL